ncbi:MAG: DUF2809 domain-containing protein [Chitinophagaceae bacterium]|nr:DUF2809 domain-containing protein [Chitinophagaceae bacterium]
MPRIHKTYLLFTVLLFVTEVLIALFVHDNFIRPYVGDVLVVILLYCLLKTFFTISPVKAAIAVLIFSFVVEGLQYLHVAEWLGLTNNQLAMVLMGNSFSWLDLLAYVAGILFVLLAEKWN